jgi:hypothetical protein
LFSAAQFVNRSHSPLVPCSTGISTGKGPGPSGAWLVGAMLEEEERGVITGVIKERRKGDEGAQWKC